MPYIKQEDRIKFISSILELSSKIETEGELNYVITMLSLMFSQRTGTINYSELNKTIGVLECAKQEFYRRFVAPYENKKIDENGDILNIL